MKPTLGKLFSSVLLLLPNVAMADTFTLSSRLETATVFTNAASLRRSGRAQLTAGEHQVVFTGLPTEMVDDSVRVSGLGPAVVVESVTIRTATMAEVPSNEFRQLMEEAASAERERVGLLRQREDLLRQRTPLGMVDARIAQATARAAQLNEQVRVQGARPIKAVLVDVTAARQGALELTLEYLASGVASWTPAYAAHLDPDTGRVALDVYASVQQRTGEDWRGIRLSVSTITPDRGLALPRLDELALALEPQEEPEREVSLDLHVRRSVAARPTMAGAPAMPSSPVSEPPVSVPPAPIEQRQGVARSGTLAARIELPQAVTVRSGAVARRLLASHLDVEGSIEHHAAPSQSGSVFLAARWQNTARFPLLAGPVGLFIRDEYVGSTQLETVPVEESVSLPFGIDSGLTIERTALRRNLAQQAGREETTVRYQYRLVNHRDRAVRVTVFERVPVSHTHGLNVRVLPGGPARRESTAGDAPGVLRWNMELTPNGTTRWDFGFVVHHPRGRTLIGEL